MSDKPISTLADVLDSIRTGMVLRIRHDLRSAAMIEGFSNPGPARPSIPVDINLALSCAVDHSFTRLTELRNGSRCGWRELGLNGSDADLYVCTQ